MKKFFFGLVMLFCCVLGSNAQKVAYDKIENNYRVVESTGITIRRFTDSYVWSYGIKAIQNLNNDSISYHLIINISAGAQINIKNDGLLLIKLYDDTIIELQNNNIKYTSTNIGHSYVKPIIGNIGSVISHDIHCNIAYFEISEEDLIKFSQGILKVRLETTSGYKERKYTSKHLGKKLYEAYLNIKECLNTPYKDKTKQSIKDNF